MEKLEKELETKLGKLEDLKKREGKLKEREKQVERREASLQAQTGTLGSAGKATRRRDTLALAVPAQQEEQETLPAQTCTFTGAVAEAAAAATGAAGAAVAAVAAAAAVAAEAAEAADAADAADAAGAAGAAGAGRCSRSQYSCNPYSFNSFKLQQLQQQVHQMQHMQHMQKMPCSICRPTCRQCRSRTCRINFSQCISHCRLFSCQRIIGPTVAERFANKNQLKLAIVWLLKFVSQAADQKFANLMQN